MAKSLNREEEDEKFNEFVFHLPDRIEELRGLAAKAGHELDGSLDSLDELERFYLALLDRKADPDLIERVELLSPGYIGDVVRKAYGGRWKLNIENPRHLFYGQPVIFGHAGDKLEFSPFFVFKGVRARRSPGVIRRAIESNVKPKPLDLSSLPTE